MKYEVYKAEFPKISVIYCESSIYSAASKQIDHQVNKIATQYKLAPQTTIVLRYMLPYTLDNPGERAVSSYWLYNLGAEPIEVNFNIMYAFMDRYKDGISGEVEDEKTSTA